MSLQNGSDKALERVSQIEKRIVNLETRIAELEKNVNALIKVALISKGKTLIKQNKEKDEGK